MLLVAEDHPTNRAVIARQLDAMGYDYTLVENGQQALDAMAAVDFDLLITDCHMPQLDGYALTRRIRSREGREKHFPIIALSASALPEQVQRCIDAGMDDFLAKPVQFAQLKAKLEQFLPQIGAHAPALVTQQDAQPTMQHANRRDDGVWQRRNPIEQLCRDFGSRKSGLNLVRQLIATTHEDLATLASLPYSASQARRDLLHRIEGAMRIVRLSEDDGVLSMPYQDSPAREAEVRNQLKQLEALLVSYQEFSESSDSNDSRLDPR